jgi:hypothetical protein
MSMTCLLAIYSIPLLHKVASFNTQKSPDNRLNCSKVGILQFNYLIMAVYLDRRANSDALNANRMAHIVKMTAKWKRTSNAAALHQSAIVTFN